MQSQASISNLMVWYRFVALLLKILLLAAFTNQVYHSYAAYVSAQSPNTHILILTTKILTAHNMDRR